MLTLYTYKTISLNYFFLYSKLFHCARCRISCLVCIWSRRNEQRKLIFALAHPFLYLLLEDERRNAYCSWCHNIILHSHEHFTSDSLLGKVSNHISIWDYCSLQYNKADEKCNFIIVRAFDARPKSEAITHRNLHLHDLRFPSSYLQFPIMFYMCARSFNHDGELWNILYWILSCDAANRWRLWYHLVFRWYWY